MLYLLTGKIQTGKTRWLEHVLDRLADRGVDAAGVIAPGVWRERTCGFEKLGIDNVLLPERARISFGWRADLKRDKGGYDANSQSVRAQLAWAIDDVAIERVNRHFERISQQERRMLAAGRAPAHPRLLVVDELGRLELMRGEGLTAAMRRLDRGATALYPSALVIVRAALVEKARERFAAAPWGGIEAIAPDGASARMLSRALLGSTPETPR